MLQIEQFEKDQVWILTNGPKRAAQVLEKKVIMVSRPGEKGRPPIKEQRTAVTVKVCSPARSIDGFVDTDEATFAMNNRRRCMRDYGYDMWQEVWIDEPRQTYNPNPRIKNDDQWEYMVRVHQVIGRHGAHEGQYKAGRITGSEVDGILVPADKVPTGLFDDLGDDVKTQKELDRARLKQDLRLEIEKELKVAKQEVRQGDCAEYLQWGPVSKLKSQARACGVRAEDIGDGRFCEKLRHGIAEYLRGLGINPWDVYELPKDEFRDALNAAKLKVVT